MKKLYMLNGGEFNNIKNISIKNMEFERYCKDEGVNSIQLKRDVNKLYYNKRNNFLSYFISLIISVINKK